MAQQKCIVLISCTKSNTSYPAPARELYSPSHLFTKALAYVEPYADVIYILSAKHGLIALDQRLEPYEQTLKSMRPRERAAWAQQVFSRLQELHGSDLSGFTFEFHTGQEYREHLAALLTRAGAACTCPVEGLAIGERMQFYGQKGTTAPRGAEQPKAPEQQGKTPFDRVWSRIVAHAGQTFRQARGGEFRFELAGPHTLRLDRTNQALSYAVLQQAFAFVPLPNTSPVQHLRAPSYLYAILMDPRIRQPDW